MFELKPSSSPDKPSSMAAPGVSESSRACNPRVRRHQAEKGFRVRGLGSRVRV